MSLGTLVLVVAAWFGGVYWERDKLATLKSKIKEVWSWFNDPDIETKKDQ